MALYAHLDIRSFYAACEQYLNPELKGKPLVVYNEGPTGLRSIIAVSREAKRMYGLSRDASMSIAEILPGVVLLPSRKEVYDHLAALLFEQCKEYVEGEGGKAKRPYIDDMVIELHDSDLGKAMELTRKIEEFYRQFGFQVAIGIAFNEDYANIAAKEAKKYGFIYFGKGFAQRFFYNRPVIEFPQIGHARQKRLNQAGIFTIGDIADSSLDLIMEILGSKRGMKIYYSVLAEQDKSQLELFENE